MRRVDERDLLITDGERPVALAAIMGGADSEVVDGDDRGAAGSGELRADRRAEDLGAPRPPHGGLEPLGEGRRPVSRRARRRAREQDDRRPRRGRARRERRRARRPAAATRRPPPARAHRPDRRARRRAAEQREILERLGFEVERRLGRDGPDVARARRHARDRPRRGGRARRARPRAAHDAAAPLGRRAPDPRPAAAARSSRTCSSVPASARPIPGASSPPIPTRRDPAARSDERRPGDSPHDAARGPDRAAAENVDAGNEDIALFELARVYLPSGERAARGALARRRHRRRGLRGRAGRRRGALRRHCTSSFGQLRATSPFLHPGKAAHDRGRLARGAPSGAARRHVGSVRARPRRADGTDSRADPLRRRDHVPAAAPGHRRRRCRGGRGGRARRCGARGRGTRAARGARLRRLSRRSGRRRPQVGRHPSLAAGCRPDALGRGRRRSSASRIVAALVDRFDAELRG